MVAVSTINGYIADKSGQYPWASAEDRIEFMKLYEKAGCIIIGRRTYDNLKNRKPFPTPGRHCVVVTRDTSYTSNNPHIVFQPSPRDAFLYLKKMGFENVLIGGGGKLNASFAREYLIDEIVLTVEPVAIDTGTPLFDHPNQPIKLTLLSETRLNNFTIQLHYHVLK